MLLPLLHMHQDNTPPANWATEGGLPVGGSCWMCAGCAGATSGSSATAVYAPAAGQCEAVGALAWMHADGPGRGAMACVWLARGTVVQCLLQCLSCSVASPRPTPLTLCSHMTCSSLLRGSAAQLPQTAATLRLGSQPSSNRSEAHQHLAAVLFARRAANHTCHIACQSPAQSVL